MQGSLGAVILTGGALCIEELVTRGAISLCASCVHVLGYPRLQDKFHHHVVTQEPAGSSHLVPAIMPPVWPRLCPKVQHEVVM